MRVDYLIREYGDGYEVTKWEEWGGKRPDALYTVEFDHLGYWYCSCIGYRHHGYCKHTSMVRNWLRKGKPRAIPMVLGFGPWGWGL